MCPAPPGASRGPATATSCARLRNKSRTPTGAAVVRPYGCRVPKALALCAAALVLLVAAPNVRAAWQPPVDGDVLRRFATGPDPYARGQHRGVDLAAAPGATVRAACPGRVRFAGAVAG